MCSAKKIELITFKEFADFLIEHKEDFEKWYEDKYRPYYGFGLGDFYHKSPFKQGEEIINWKKGIVYWWSIDYEDNLYDTNWNFEELKEYVNYYIRDRKLIKKP